MPELPEVEVSKMGISPHLVGQSILSIDVRQPKLRWPIPCAFQQLQGETIVNISRRAKYLLVELNSGTIVIHLGMSGSLRVLNQYTEPGKHDHVDLKVNNGKILRYNDPRRFGAWLWYPIGAPINILQHLGPEPLTDQFNSSYIESLTSKRRVAVKQFIMDNKVVVGVGNIYTNESLFNAQVNPLRPANSLTSKEWDRLVEQIKIVLAQAIEQGGTTLNDFEQPNGKPGYFAQKLMVYGRAGEPCLSCGSIIQSKKIGQRNTFWCEECQK